MGNLELSPEHTEVITKVCVQLAHSIDCAFTSPQLMLAAVCTLSTDL